MCPYCFADWSTYSETDDTVLGFKLRGLNNCCSKQVEEWVIEKSRLSTRNKIRVLREFGIT